MTFHFFQEKMFSIQDTTLGLEKSEFLPRCVVFPKHQGIRPHWVCVGELHTCD
jgi:hypothetical protein